MKITVTGFENGSPIPGKFTCDGEDLSPEIRWEEVPRDAKTIALIMYDPDAPLRTFNHWLFYNIPVELRSLPPGIQDYLEIPGKGTSGTNDFGSTGYKGPCPPAGKPHRYFFELLALNTDEKIEAGLKRSAFDEAIDGSVIEKASHMGNYRRKS